jgi:hypothetical protein
MQTLSETVTGKPAVVHCIYGAHTHMVYAHACGEETGQSGIAVTQPFALRSQASPGPSPTLLTPPQALRYMWYTTPCTAIYTHRLTARGTGYALACIS